MTHTLTKCIKDTDTKLTTDRDSYIYECPVCNMQARYAEPVAPEYVFHDGIDFGTKVEVNGTLIEVSQYLYLKGIAAGERPTTDDYGLEALGYIELAVVEVDENGVDVLAYILTDTGREFI